MNKNNTFVLALLLTSLIAVSGCATKPTDPDELIEYNEANDPLEPTNRFIFGFNQIVDKVIITPVTKVYRYVVPEYGRQRIGGIIDNLGEPVNFFNNVMQGRGSDAADTVARFAMNSTVGLFGMFDVAKDLGVPERHADFGQTLHTYGVGEGPYLVLPLLGPSNPRDAAGFAADMAMDPWNYAAHKIDGHDTAQTVRYVRWGTTIIDRRDATLDLTDQLERDSFDYYATMRSISRQYRAKQLQGQDANVPGAASLSPSN